jgi:two-component system KDP operon response regulator KdpE
MADALARVLVVDDEKQIRRVLETALPGHGYAVTSAASGFEALNQAAIVHPDLVVLDLGLPDLDGTEIIRRLREWTGVPIIVLSVREDENDKIKALDAGADDYVTKPFRMGELLARMRVALRRAARPEAEPVLTFGDLVVDLLHRKVLLKGEELHLTPTEYEILKYLALQAGKVVTHSQVLRAVWGPNSEGETHYLRIYVASLRRKIEADPSQPSLIVTEPGVGYRLVGKE